MEMKGFITFEGGECSGKTTIIKELAKEFEKKGIDFITTREPGGIRIAEDIISLCEKEKIWYELGGGTALGAIRHHGFIPWDDDIDVALSRDDYNKLCEVADKEFSDPYFFQTALTDKNYFVGHARLRNSNTTGIVSFLCDHIYNNGIYIDIL